MAVIYNCIYCGKPIESDMVFDGTYEEFKIWFENKERFLSEKCDCRKTGSTSKNKTTFTQEEKQSFHELCRQAHLQAHFGLMGSLEDNGYAVSFMVACNTKKINGAIHTYRHVEITICGDEFLVEKHNGYKKAECTSFNEAIQQAREYLKGV